MPGVLAIETSTDACSVAVSLAGKLSERFEIAPRQHNQRLFSMLSELLSPGDLQSHGIDAIAYGNGPGSFTGLRIAASAVQGLSYASHLPAVGVSSLATLAQTALRRALVPHDALVLCTCDARINEVYAAVYGYANGLAELRAGPWVCAPSAIPIIDAEQLHVIGTGGQFSAQYPELLQQRIASNRSELFPAAQDLIPLALAMLKRDEVQSPTQVQPVYLRDEISWKKLAQQGKRP